MPTEATSPAAVDRQGPIEVEIPGPFKVKFAGPPTKFVIMCGLALGAVLGGAWLLGAQGRDLFPLDPTAVYAMQAAACLTLVVSFFSDYCPRIVSRWREERLREWGLHGRPGKPGYFRLGPYEDNENDRRDYDRPDNVHREVLEWLKQTTLPLVYLTGQSGCGKSSLLNAYVLPELRERNGVETIRVRSFADTLDELRQQLIALSERLKLYKATPDWMRTDPLREVLEKLVTRWKSAGDSSLDKEVVPFRLLIVVDQLEELIIVNQLREGDDSSAPVPAEETTQLSERVAAVQNLLFTLSAQPVTGVRILLALRSDYRTMLRELDLPSIYKPDILREVGPFTRAQAKAILEHEHCGFVAREKRLKSMLSEASIVDGNRGLIRPIVINMLGRVLQIHSDKEDLPTHEEGRLLSQEVREAVEYKEIREHAANILDLMLTDTGTKIPRRVDYLKKKTGLDEHIIEGTLMKLGDTDTPKGLGLVRRIIEAEEAADRVWEISHDFVAQLLGPVVRTPRVSQWIRVRYWFSPALFLIYAILCWGVFDYYRQAPVRLRSRLAEFAITLDTLGDVGVRATANSSTFREHSMTHIGPLLASYGGVTVLDLSGCESLRDLEGLRQLTTLQKIHLSNCKSLTSLDGLQGLPALRSLILDNSLPLESFGGLQGLLALETLELSNTHTSSLEGLRDLPMLTMLDVSNCIFLKNLDGVQGLPSLKELNVRHCNSLTNLDGLRWLPELTVLDISNTKVSSLVAIPELQSLEQLIGTNIDLKDFRGCPHLPSLHTLDLSRTKITAVSEIRRFPSLQAIDLSYTDLTSLEGLEDLLSLKALNLSGLPENLLPQLAGLPELRALIWLNVGDLGELPRMPKLQEFDIGTSMYNVIGSSLMEFHPLIRLPSLEVVYARGLSSGQVASIREICPEVKLVESFDREYRHPLSNLRVDWR